jgi:Family of unknown function (DUF5317)
MFILYAVVVGIVAGFVLGGRPDGLAALRIRWSAVILAGLLVQVVLFTDAVAARVGDLGPAIYVASTGLVLAAVIRNAAIPGIPVVALGATTNLVAIVVNGGYMPAGRGALEALGKLEPTIYSNSSVVADPMLWPLTDIFALPGWLPFANIFSVGDVVIGLGIVLTIVLAMRRPAAARSAPGPAPHGAWMH